MGIRKDCKSIKYRIINSKEGLCSKPSILLCGLDSYQKQDIHREAKRAEFNPLYSMKHPSVKVLIKRSSSVKIETEKLKTNTLHIEQLRFMYRSIL